VELNQCDHHEVHLRIRIRKKLRQLKDMDMTLSEIFVWLEQDTEAEFDVNMGYFL